MNKPGYLNLLENGQLEEMVKLLRKMLADCVLCPHQCKVNRLKGERGYCRTLDNVVIMPDIKFSDDEAAHKYLGVKNYYTIAKAAVKEMHRQVGNLKADDRNIGYKGPII